MSCRSQRASTLCLVSTLPVVEGLSNRRLAYSLSAGQPTTTEERESNGGIGAYGVSSVPAQLRGRATPWALDEEDGLRGTTGNSRKTRSTHAFPKKRAVKTCDTSCRALCPLSICLRAYLEERNIYFLFTIPQACGSSSDTRHRARTNVSV